MVASAFTICLAIDCNVFSGRAPTWSVRFYKLDFALSWRTETHPSGEFQNVSWTFKKLSDEHVSCQTVIQFFKIPRDSRLASGTSFTQ